MKKPIPVKPAALMNGLEGSHRTQMSATQADAGLSLPVAGRGGSPSRGDAGSAGASPSRGADVPHAVLKNHEKPTDRGPTPPARRLRRVNID